MFRRCVAIVLALASLVAPAAPAAAAEPFTLDSVLSAPFVDELAVSPDRRALVWTVHERGARNVAVWSGGVAREVTHASDDDGAELDSPQITPDGTAVVYARGGAGQDGGGEDPNPASPVVRADRRIFLTALGGGEPLLIGVGRSPAVSPKGDRVAWIGPDKQVWSATLATKDNGTTWSAGKPERLFTVRGSTDAPLWSPDGTRLAVTNDRGGDHAFIAIYALGAGNVVFAAPGFGNDASPVWSPDGSRIAFVRLPGAPYNATAYDDPATFPPWGIVVADAHTGAGRVVWRSLPGRGHEFTIADGVQPLWWTGGRSLAFIWERDGWRHLYSLQLGGTPRLITPGAFDIEQIAATAGGHDLLYTSNEGDIDARHVWRVSPRDGTRHRLSAGPNNQWSPVELADGTVAFVDAGFAAPGEVTLSGGVGAGGAAGAGGAPRPVIAAATPATFPTSLVQPKLVTFKAPDGLTIHGQLFEPSGGGKHPALIFVHGGPERQMLAGFHYFEAYTNLYEMNQYLVARGFAVLSVNYRSGIMYGHDFYEPPKRGWLGASEYQDVLAGAKFLGKRPEVDARRLGIYGLSYGGYLTALALARNSDVFAAGADFAGVHDWPRIIDSWYGHPVGTAAQRAVAYAASPVASIATWRSPVFLDQGDDDRNVPFEQGVELAYLLQARYADLTTLVFPDELHEYTVYAHELVRFQKAADFLSARLRI